MEKSASTDNKSKHKDNNSAPLWGFKGADDVLVHKHTWFNVSLSAFTFYSNNDFIMNECWRLEWK